MKVDKAVCTTDTMTDVQSTVRYETLLSTLFQNKVLAIKRDCEAKQQAKERRKQKNFLGAIIFGNRRHQCDDKSNDSNPSINLAENVTGNKKEVGGVSEMERNVFAHGNQIDNNDDTKQIDNSTVSINRNNLVENVAQTTNENVITAEALIESKENSTRNECERSSSKSKSSEKQTIDCGIVINMHANEPSCAQQHPNDTNLNKAIIISVEEDAHTTTANSKSLSQISQTDASDDGSIKHISRDRKNSSDTISVPSLTTKHTTFSAPIDTIATYDQEHRHRLHVLEAKSISAQCSPVFPQRQIFTGMASTQSKHTTTSLAPHRLYSRQNTSDDSVNVTFNSIFVNETNDDGTTVIGTDIATSTTTNTNNNKNNKRLMKSQHSSGSGGKTSFFKKSGKQTTSSVNSNVNNDAHGFITSFNQLTSNNLPVITSKTTTSMKYASNGGEIEKTNERTSQRDTMDITKHDDSDEYSIGQKLSISTKGHADDDKSKSNKRKYSEFLQKP